MATTNTSVSGVAQPVSSRGPAPPLPEKPPSVAERTRLLKSSFRSKDDVEKPRMDVNRSSPLSEVTRSAGSSVSSLNSPGNGEREESPPTFVNGVSSNNVPSKPTVPLMDNREAEKQATVVSCLCDCIVLIHSLAMIFFCL